MKEQKVQIAFFDTKPYDSLSFDAVNADFGYTIKYFKPRLSSDTVKLADGFDIVCAFVNDDLGSDVLQKLIDYGVCLVVMRCAGYNNVDLKIAFGKIHVLRVPAYSPYAVAEHALALILSLNRKIHKAYYRTRDMNFSINGLLGFDLHGKTAGVIGTGKIGWILIHILKGLGMEVLAYDPFPNVGFAETEEIRYVELSELYVKSDVISLHCPLTKETFHLIDKDSIAQMKPGVMIVNTSRGQLIDTRALIGGLKERKIGCAGLDVYEEEGDYFFEDLSNELIEDDVLARLMTFPNVLVTSHQAFFTREALHNIASTTLNNVQSFFEKSDLVNEICYQCGETPGNCTKTKIGRCF